MFQVQAGNGAITHLAMERVPSPAPVAFGEGGLSTATMQYVQMWFPPHKLPLFFYKKGRRNITPSNFATCFWGGFGQNNDKLQYFGKNFETEELRLHFWLPTSGLKSGHASLPCVCIASNTTGTSRLLSAIGVPNFKTKEHVSAVNMVDEKFGIKSNRFLCVDDSVTRPSSAKSF